MRFTHVLMAVAAIATVGVASVATAVAGDAQVTVKPKTGQLCNKNKKPPAGFKCVKKNATSRYRLAILRPAKPRPPAPVAPAPVDPAPPPLIGTLTSSAFTAGGPIPALFTCNGTNNLIAPDLAWSGMPAETKAYALLVDDSDAGDFVHWLTWNIAASATGLASGQNGAGVGTNGFGTSGYSGPCPPPGSGVHNYVFHLYALSSELTLAPGSRVASFDAAILSKAIGEARLTGTYSR